MFRVLINYPPEYNTPVKVHTVANIEDAHELVAEAEQCFGQGMILTKGEFDKVCNSVGFYQRHYRTFHHDDDDGLTNDCGDANEY